MDDLDWNTFLKRFNCNTPASASQIARIETRAQLPEDYKSFLRKCNGGEGFLGANAYAIFWPAEELIDLNDAYRVAEYSPGLFLFGSDGGGEAFAFDLHSDAKPVVSVPFVGMDRSLIRELAPTFTEFLKSLFAT